MNYLNCRRGQAVVEMALFGSLVLFLFGSLLSYIQRQNDQQYVQMEVFRRALEKGCTYVGEETEGAGASVQFTLIQNRKHADVGGGFRKGNTQLLSASSSIFWAVPKVQSDPDNIIVFRINEDEKQIKYRDFVPKDQDSTDDEGNERQKYLTFETEDMQSQSEVSFNEELVKREDQQGITNEKRSALEEEFRFNIPYKVKEVDKDDEDYEAVKKEGFLWEDASGTRQDLTQHLYRDEDEGGAYKYSSRAPEAPVIRRSAWRTEFDEE